MSGWFLKLIRGGSMGPGNQVELGIYGAKVALGSHIAFHWEREAEFAEVAGFLHTGFQKSDPCIVVGDDGTIYSLVRALLQKEWDVTGLLNDGRLKILEPADQAQVMISRIEEAIRWSSAGASCVRFLGAPAWGHPGWPEEHKLLRVEQAFNRLCSESPCIAICTYDQRMVPERILSSGALGTHPLEIRSGALRSNPGFKS